MQHPPKQGVQAEGMGRVWGKGVYRCVDLSLLPNPPWLAKLACLDAAKAVVT